MPRLIHGFIFALVTLMMPIAAMASLPEFTRLVKEASPAVVNITATRSSPPEMQGFDEREVPEFFRRFFQEYERRSEPRPAAGSGFIISKDGFILTNHHVVDGADEVVVALSDRRETEAEIVGTDPLSDLALLKIDLDDLQAVKMGSSEKLEVGEWVVAIGSPFGFELSVTAGIVSAKQRSLGAGGNNYIPFIQTDVAINPGNSGGPLFDLDGRVVGINSQIFTRSGGFMGLSFAIPVDVAMEVVDQLKENGSVSRGYLGVQIQRVDRDLAESFGLDRPSGALVTQVFGGSPAEAAGIREGDIITEFNGRMIDLSAHLPFVVGRTPAGSDATVLIVRDGKRSELTVNVGQLPQDPTEVARRSPASPQGNRLGVIVEDLPREVADGLEGVLIVSVTAGPGRTAGLRRGDVITTLDHTPIDSASTYESIVEGLDADVAVPVRIIRNGQPQFLVVKIEE